MNKIYLGTQEVANTGSGGSGEAFDPSYLEKGLLDTSTKLEALVDYVDNNIETIDSSLDDHEERIKVLEASTGGSGGGGDVSGYVDTSTFDEAMQVAASALVNLKGLEKNLETLENSLQYQENALLAEVQAVEVNKADVSTVYTKNDIDNSDKVVAAALASQNARLEALETNSSVFITENDISTFVTNNDLSTFVEDSSITSNYYNKEHIDASFAAIESGSGSSIPENVLQYVEVTQNGLMFVDASMNIGVAIDSSGLHAFNLVEFNEIN